MILTNPPLAHHLDALWKLRIIVYESNRAIQHNDPIGVLKREYYLLYADYIRKFFDAYKEKGIKIWGMTPGNEPINGIVPNFSFNAMLWTPETEANFSANFLEPTLSKAGYNDIVYMALDDQRFEIPWYPDGVFKNEKANEIFKGTAVHWYADYMFKPYRLDLLHEKYPDKFILMTEACTGKHSARVSCFDKTR